MILEISFHGLLGDIRTIPANLRHNPISFIFALEELGVEERKHFEGMSSI